MPSRRRRQRQRGQVLVVSALMGVLLIGAAALAVDLSVQTDNRRALQNVTDVAALAGARDLFDGTTALDPAQQTSAVADALATVQRDMGWPDAWLSGAQACSSWPPASFAQYGLSGQCEQVAYGDYTVTVSTPPASPRSLADLDPHDVQVDMRQTSHNGLAGVIGFSTATEGGHSVARHYPAGTTLGFALFSNDVAQAGNINEKVAGNVYAARAVVLQSNGSSSLCAQSTSGNDDGYIVLGDPQTSSDGQLATTPHTTPFVTLPSGTTCDSVTQNGVYETGAGLRSSPPTCPSISGLSTPLVYNSAINACVTVPLTPPQVQPPPLAGNVVQVNRSCRGNGGGGGGGHSGTGMSGCWNNSTNVADGMYVVNHDTTCVPPACYDLEISASMSLGHVTFWLKPDATFDVNMQGSSGTLTVQGPYNAGTGQPDDGKLVIYGQGGSQFSLHGNNQSITFLHGSIYMPGGTVSGGSSSTQLSMPDGQAITGTWNIQTGAQNNPDIGYSTTYLPPSMETLRLVE
jgi:Putative Flp pilus-assembly TadE/G-like